MKTPQTFIIINGSPKALEIEALEFKPNGVYAVKFKNSHRTYHYRQSDIVWLKESVWHDHTLCQVFVNGTEQRNISNLLSFAQGRRNHWRITYSNGCVQDYLDTCVHVTYSCLTDTVAKDAFNYLKRVAQTNELGKGGDTDGMLYAQYDKIDFIDASLSAALYLNPDKYKINTLHSQTSSLVFPFGCNSSQWKAVRNAFGHKISVIQGPPGTGKTQTILNIIANILIQGKTALVVSNNNSATSNVLEKLQKENLDFIAASLGNNANKEEFIKHQPSIPQELKDWQSTPHTYIKLQIEITHTLEQLEQVFQLQEELARCKSELQAVEVEWQHFKQYHKTDIDLEPTHKSSSQRLLQQWLQYQTYTESSRLSAKGGLTSLKRRISWIWLYFSSKYLLKLKTPINATHIDAIIQELQTLYYQTKQYELTQKIDKLEDTLQTTNAKALSDSLASQSMYLLRVALCNKYQHEKRIQLTDTADLHCYADKVLNTYPIVLSTTFSARHSLPNVVYDYIIMDEASQVSSETGLLALTCGRNAVIVGDTMQLPNVVSQEDKNKLNAIFEQYSLSDGYNCANHSFLDSVCTLLPHAPQTLLREHYRCHPKIINFCNQKFYGGNLLIMTDDNGETNSMRVIKTVPGHHSRAHYNQREIDVIQKEVLPELPTNCDAGIISPYNAQVNQLNQQMNGIEAATVHKYQGREKDTIIFSVVDDQITPFSDDANLLNVAISRAKKHFCLVVSGNEQPLNGNISDLIDYIEYNKFAVTDSKVHSIFDYLYTQYTTQRLAYLQQHSKISEYDSENLTYSLVQNVLKAEPSFAHLGTLCHIPLRTLINDTSLMSEEELKYAANHNTHLDFLIINHVSKKPVLAIETDGYSYHNEHTEQHTRDEKKNHILELYQIPLLRLSTVGSGEANAIRENLFKALNIQYADSEVTSNV